ncbi:MAG: helix-turn-helix domain-containing protein [Pyrinomonadaceae bacterium]
MNENQHKFARVPPIDESPHLHQTPPARVRAAISQPAPAHDRRIELILMLLETNPQRQWELAGIAKSVNLSPGRLAHLFKNETGTSIQQYLTRIRLANARRQLESTFLSIKEIAAAAGFRNVTRFSTTFKNAVGTTPAEYRKSAPNHSIQRKHLAIAKSANR